MRLSKLTMIGAAAALALALGVGGPPVMAQGMPDQPSAGAGPSGPEGGAGGEGGGMPLPQDRDMGAAPDAVAPPAGAESEGGMTPDKASPQKEAEKTLPADEGPSAGKTGTEAEGAGKATAETGMEKGDRKTGAEVKGQTRTGAEVEGDAKTGEAKTGAEMEGDAKTGATEKGMKDGEGKAAVKVEPEQKTKITSYFRENKPDVKVVEKSSLSVSIGIVVPAAISLHPLPADIIVVAGDCSLLYFLWGSDLVLVDSCSRHVVDIIPGIV